MFARFAGRRRGAALLPAVFVTFILGMGAVSAADLSQAVVRQKVNVVTIAPTLNAEAHPASTGAIVQEANVVRTGSESRAELEFSDLTLTRMGANSIFSFDAAARTITCNQGTILFAKPSNSGRVEVRAGAISAAITGSTGFVSNRKVTGAKAKAAAPGERATMMGMIEGKLKGYATWRDQSGREHKFAFNLGAGEMIVAQPGLQPTIVQFDIPHFVATSPLITAYSSPLPNNAQLNRALAAYQADVRRGFVDAQTLPGSRGQVQFGWTSVNRNSFDASVQALGGTMSAGNGGFIPVGSDGVIRGQLIWQTFADLDLHLLLPDSQHVYYGNRSVTFNNGNATAMLDHDNLGGTIDVQPSTRVENIAITGSPTIGTYQFYVNSFSTPNSSDPFTLTVGNGGHTQTITGNLTPGQTSQTISVTFPPGG
jgi:hypothetical protein